MSSKYACYDDAGGLAISSDLKNKGLKYNVSYRYPHIDLKNLLNTQSDILITNISKIFYKLSQLNNSCADPNNPKIQFIIDNKTINISRSCISIDIYNSNNKLGHITILFFNSRNNPFKKIDILNIINKLSFKDCFIEFQSVNDYFPIYKWKTYN